MFSLERKPTFKQEVKVNVKTDNAWREEKFTGVFKRVGDARQKELVGTPVNEVVDEVLVGWEMVDLERKPVEFTAEAVLALKDLPGASMAVAMAFFAANTGAKEKN